MIHSFYFRRICRPLLLFFFGLALLSCGSRETTPRGVILQKDLRAFLPAEVATKAPPEEDAEQHQAEIRRLSDGNAIVLITWTTFKNGQSSYLLSIDFLVTQPAAGTKIQVSVSDPPANAGPEQAVIETLPAKINWERPGLFSKHSGTQAVLISSTGECKSQ